MKLPVFVYDYTAKQYKLFPYHLLITLSNGKQGIRVHRFSYRNSPELWDAITRYRHYFESNFQEDIYSGTREYTLKEQR